MQTRPTADRVREALFSIIQSRFDVAGARVLDLCAGTGALGIESLSRGASSCCFVECDCNALSSIRRNLATVRFQDQAEVISMEAIKALRLLGKRGTCFDLIFFDPPYLADLYQTVPFEVSSLSLLSADGLFIAESSARNVLPEKIGSLVKINSRTYGDTALNFYVLEE
jgi:16S rRNA (guanine(966)-N(2))-methyltransferase RsmD